MSDTRRNLVSPEEAKEKAIRRKIRTWGGVLVGTTALGIALVMREQVVPLMLVAIVSYGIADFSQVLSIWKK